MVDLDTAIWREEFGLWLAPHSWDWFCSLSFRPGLRERQCWWRLRRWLGELKSELGGPDFGWFATREFGKTKENLHFHLLIKGITDPGPDNRVEFMRRWSKLAGDPLISLYVPNPRGISYILKDAGPDDPDCYDFDLADSSKLDEAANKK
jgi:hypothetical protein